MTYHTKHTHYEARNSGDMNHSYRRALYGMKKLRKVPKGWVLLFQNSNYSNTTKQCVYLKEKHKVDWNNKPLK